MHHRKSSQCRGLNRNMIKSSLSVQRAPTSPALSLGCHSDRKDQLSEDMLEQMHNYTPGRKSHLLVSVQKCTKEEGRVEEVKRARGGQHLLLFTGGKHTKDLSDQDTRSIPGPNAGRRVIWSTFLKGDGKRQLAMADAQVLFGTDTQWAVTFI